MNSLFYFTCKPFKGIMILERKVTRMIYITHEQLIVELKKVLLERHITQRELAKRLNISPQNLNKLLNKKNFSFEDFKRILDSIDCDLDVTIVPH